LGIPPKLSESYNEFSADVEKMWHGEMISAIAEEAALSAQKHDDMPLITVIVDGGYQKASHGHNYNSNCGTAVLIGRSKITNLGFI
jgi:hypothetical protein